MSITSNHYPSFQVIVGTSVFCLSVSNVHRIAAINVRRLAKRKANTKHNSGNKKYNNNNNNNNNTKGLGPIYEHH